MVDASDWLSSTLSVSDKTLSFLLGTEPNDTFGWKAMFSAMLEQNDTAPAPGRQPPKKDHSYGILLTGPDGCGKHTAASHMLDLLDQRGFGFAILDGESLCEDGMTVAAARLNALADQFYDEKKGLCILLENTEQLTCRQKLLTLLGQLLHEYWLYSSDLPPLFLILIDRKEHNIPSVLRRRLHRVHMNLPSTYQRKQLLEDIAADIRKYIPMDDFIAKTEGATCAQLVDMVSSLRAMVDAWDRGIVAEEFDSFIASQLVPPTSRDMLKQLTRTAQQLLQQLPALVQQAGTITAAQKASAVPSATPQTDFSVLNDKANYLSKREAEIKNMKVRDLSIQMFGEDGVNQLQSKYKSQQMLLTQ